MATPIPGSNFGGTGASQPGAKLPPVAEDGSRLKIHNAELFVECMQSAEWSPSRKGEKVVVTMTAKEAARKQTDGARLSNAERAKKAREAFVEKQSMRDHEFKMKLDVAKKEAERRQRERLEKKEKAFEKSFQDFQEANRRLAAEVEGAIIADEQWRQRKKERLYNEWTYKVFQPMQDQINLHLSSMTQEEMEERRRVMFQAFLDESNKKTNGLFRDIVIESDYDPMQQMRDSTIKYQSVSLADDPTKNRATRELHDPRTKGLIMHTLGAKNTARLQQQASEKRTAVSVEQWAHMEATPYGRYSDEDLDPSKRRSKPNFMRSSVKIDHFDVPSGDEGNQLLRIENNVRGKRIVKPPFELERERQLQAEAVVPLPKV